MKHPVVSREEWFAARKALLAKEKEWTRLRDRLGEERRELPWVRIDKEYAFDGPNGHETLGDLFAGRSQLIVKHFMLGPGWTDPCVGCSFQSDHVDGVLVHLEHHDVSYVTVARAPLVEIEAVKRRMGWHFRWVSSYGSEFNYDFNVSFTPEQIAGGRAIYNYREGATPIEEMSGLSVFYKDESGTIFHTYSTFGRGTELSLGIYGLLDLAPKGRNETERGNLTDWVKLHDRYEANGYVDAGGRWRATDEEDCCR
ncbi:MAG TPA: thioredoxin family protein [Stellaceae bacterium]|nr:thioredoxin family protein [Stellaceae bacterium]